MKEFLASGVVGNRANDAQSKQRQDITEAWTALGFLEGLPEGAIRENIATLYENEAHYLLKEATASDNSGSFETVVFPIIRRIFSKLLANEIVSVQALNLPIGKLFFILPVTSERDWTVPVGEEAAAEAGDLVDGTVGRHKGLMGYNRTNRNKSGQTEERYYLPDEVVNGNPEVTKYLQKSLYDLFYDDFLYDNSRGKVTLKVGNAEAVELTAEGFKLISTPKVSGTDGTVRNLMLKVKGFNSFNASKLTGPDGNEMDTEEFLASLKVITTKAIAGKAVGATSGITSASFAQYESIPFRVVTQKYGKGIVEYGGSPVDAEGAMYIDLDLTKPVAEQGGTIDGYVGVAASELGQTAEALKNAFKIAWAHYDSLELETEIGEVSFKLDSVTVSVIPYKLRATWSPELSTDVSAFHNIDAEAELTSILSEQIAAEVDRTILKDLRKVAPWQKRFDVNGWRRMTAYSTNYTQKDWNQELMTCINQISAQINKATLRGGANWIVVSSEISALLDNLEYFHVSDASAEQNQYNMGIEKVGALSSRYQVFCDPYSPSYSMIIGHKGKSLLDTGYVYAPYVPIQLTPTMYNPFNMAPVKGISTRFAKKVTCNRYFGHVRVDGLVKFDTNELR